MKRNKFNAIKTEVDGIIFDSRAEARRYVELKLLELNGVITKLKLQPRYLLQESFVKNRKTYRKIEYIADFEYIEVATNKKIVEDVKGRKTEVYKLKKKLFEKRYPNLEIREV